MNIPKEAIEKAVEGGWRPIDEYETDVHLIMAYRHPEQIALDPTFWQSLGKALGWHQYPLCVPTKEGQQYHGDRLGQIVGESRDGTAWRVIWLGNISTYTLNKEYIKVLPRSDNWTQQAHRFYDLILTTDDTDAFWRELLDNKSVLETI